MLSRASHRVVVVSSVASETHVRAALQRDLASHAAGDQRTIEEFWVPRSHERADVVVVGGSLDGYEIKSARDGLRRLPRQAAAYGRLFDRCVAVVAARHVERTVQIVPAWWGIVIYDDRGAEIAFTIMRCAEPNPTVDLEVLVRLLWRDEAFAALNGMGMSPERTAPRGSLWRELLMVASTDDLRTIVRRAIFNRDPARARIATRRFAGDRASLEADL